MLNILVILVTVLALAIVTGHEILLYCLRQRKLRLTRERTLRANAPAQMPAPLLWPAEPHDPWAAACTELAGLALELAIGVRWSKDGFQVQHEANEALGRQSRRLAQLVATGRTGTLWWAPSGALTLLIAHALAYAGGCALPNCQCQSCQRKEQLLVLAALAYAETTKRQLLLPTPSMN